MKIKTFFILFLLSFVLTKSYKYEELIKDDLKRKAWKDSLDSLEAKLEVFKSYDLAAHSEAEAQKMFTEFDKDESGYLERPELIAFISKLVYEMDISVYTQNQIDKIFEAKYDGIDINRDRKISVSELVDRFIKDAEISIQILEELIQERKAQKQYL